MNNNRKSPYKFNNRSKEKINKISYTQSVNSNKSITNKKGSPNKKRITIQTAVNTNQSNESIKKSHESIFPTIVKNVNVKTESNYEHWNENTKDEKNVSDRLSKIQNFIDQVK